MAIEVFEGNTADPATLSAQIDKLKHRFKLQRVVMVGDHGLLTSARIEQTLRPAGLDWITALRAPAIKQLAAEGGPLQPSLFDHRDMAEITSLDYPDERLVVCKNPLLAEERARKRAELLAATEKELARIQARVQRARTPLRGAAAIGQAVGAVLGRSQRQHPPEARDVSPLLGLLGLGQARQQRFCGGNTLSVSGFPGIEIRGGFEPLTFFAV